MRIIRAADCRRMPWKNGGGETVEIAAYPEGAGLDTFVWRLSAARVAQDGPFSMFSGVDRTLAVLSGEGLMLRVGEAETALRPESGPLSFAGDQPTEARLIGGAVEDLNIMTRRGVARHRMRQVIVQGEAGIGVEGAMVLVFCAKGEVRIGDAVLGARDTLMLTDGASALVVSGQGRIYVVEVMLS